MSVNRKVTVPAGSCLSTAGFKHSGLGALSTVSKLAPRTQRSRFSGFVRDDDLVMPHLLDVVDEGAGRLEKAAELGTLSKAGQVPSSESHSIRTTY
jgi:hypothetical protein